MTRKYNKKYDPLEHARMLRREYDRIRREIVQRPPHTLPGEPQRPPSASDELRRRIYS